MPTLSTIFFVVAFGQPVAFFAALSGLALAKSLTLGPDATAYWCAAFGVLFGYMLRANEPMNITEGP